MSLTLTQRTVSLPQIVPSDVPWRRADRDTTPGRCNNLDYCSIGMRRGLVRVPVSQAFVCPECGSGLKPPGGRSTLRRRGVLPAVRVAVLAGGMALSLGAGYLFGRAQPIVTHAIASASHQVAAARLVLGPAPAPVPVVKPPAPTEPLLTQVMPKPFPSRRGPLEVTNPPDRLLHEARYGQVAIDCTLGALVTHPVCRVADTRGGDAFSNSALAWLQALAVQYAAPADHRWRVVFEDFSGQEKRTAQ